MHEEVVEVGNQNGRDPNELRAFSSAAGAIFEPMTFGL